MSETSAGRKNRETEDAIASCNASMEFEKVKDKIKVEQRGHKFAVERLAGLSLFLFTKADKTNELIKAMKTGVPCEPVTIPHSLANCWECGQYITPTFDGVTIKATTDCPLENHPGYVDFELNVPSGKMVVGNDFRGGFALMGDYNINATLGTIKTIEAYAKIGLAHGFVGNTCPSVFRYFAKAKSKFGPKRFAIGSKGNYGKSPTKLKGTKRVAGICTDLWWYSIADYDEWERRYGRKPDENADNIDIVKCEPGVYQFRHYTKVDRDNWKKDIIYADVKWIRKPDPVGDLGKEYREANYTAEQIIANMLGVNGPDEDDDGDENYYKSIGKDKVGSIMAAANQIMCVNGNGFDWHPNGWGTDRPMQLSPKDAPSIDLPVFDREHHWYEFSDYSVLANIAGVGTKMVRFDETQTLNDSFLRLAFNILQCAIRHPRTKFDPVMTEKRCAQSTRWATKIFKALAKKYPDKVPDFCQDLLPKRARKAAK